MRPPIIVNDCAIPDEPGDLSVYDTLDWAELACEPYVADDPSIRAYDSEGRALRLIADWSANRCRLEPAGDVPANPELVDRLLRRHLPRIGVSEAEAASMSFDDMLTLIYERDPNPYSGYRRPGDTGLGLWARLKRWLGAQS